MPRPCRDRAGEFLARLRADAFSNMTAAVPPRKLRRCEPFVKVRGWTNIVGLWRALVPLMRGSHGTRNLTVIEVGAWKGGSANAMSWALKCAPALRDATVNVVSVDTWLGAPEFWDECCIDADDRGGGLAKVNGFPSVFYTFARNLWQNGHDDVSAPLPLSGLEAANVLTGWNVRADAIYVDAAHETEAVKRDLYAFWPLLKPGGVLLGDDAKNHRVFRALVAFQQEYADQIGTPYNTTGGHNNGRASVWSLVKGRVPAAPLRYAKSGPYAGSACHAPEPLEPPQHGLSTCQPEATALCRMIYGRS